MSQQGSASFVIVLGGVMSLIAGAMVLTLALYPIINAFRGSGLWGMDTMAGNRMLTYIGGVWEFWGAILLLGILSFIWVRTRQ